MDKAKHYRARATEMRTIAEGIFDPKERKQLLDIAHEYAELSLRQDACEKYLGLANGPRKRSNGADHKPGRNSS
jgi:hypothetical protein